MPLDRVLQPPDTIALRMEGEARLVELALQEPRSDAQFQATAREDVQGGCLLRKDRRVPEPIAEGERAHAHPRRDGRDRGQGSQGSKLMGEGTFDKVVADQERRVAGVLGSARCDQELLLRLRALCHDAEA